MTFALSSAAGCLWLLLASCSGQPTPSADSGEPASRFHAGQVWAFKTPLSQPNAKLTVLRVENLDGFGIVVHIAISGLSLPGGQTSIPHAPLAEAAVERSVTTLEREAGPMPDFAEGYRLWSDAKGGVFTVTAAEVCELAMHAIRQGK